MMRLGSSRLKRCTLLASAFFDDPEDGWSLFVVLATHAALVCGNGRLEPFVSLA